MSRRNMSERANYGLMLCDGINGPSPIDYSVFMESSGTAAERAEDSKLGVLNGLVPNGVNKFRPLTQLLQNIGESNRDGSTPINTNTLAPEANKLFLDFIKEAVPPTGNPEADKANVQKVLTKIQGTFGLSDQQIEGLQKNLNRSTREQLSDNFQLRKGDNPNNNPWEPFGTRSRMDGNE